MNLKQYYFQNARGKTRNHEDSNSVIYDMNKKDKNRDGVVA